ncbi:MAG: glycosyltransferase [Deltaproteobacteria bacterium]|nr:glycosyltransferase [Deltaproteobacteria bacterium]
MKVSLIMPVRNEEKTVQLTLGSIHRQTRRPDELIIADGRSTDGTVQLIRSLSDADFPLQIVDNSALLAGAGRNVAIEKARFDLVAATDFGTILDPHWLEEIVKPLEDDPAVDMVGGRACPLVTNWIENCVAAVLHSSNMLRLDRFTAEEIQRLLARNPPLPGGNSVAFRKKIWQKAGGYPSWIKTSEDKLFARKVNRIGGKIAISLHAVAYYEPRDTLSKVFRQFYSYSRGNAQSRQVSNNFWKLLAKAGLGVGLFSAGLIKPLYWYALAACLGLHLYRAGFRPYLNLNENPWDLKIFLLIPAVVLTHNAASLLGHLAGYYDWWTEPCYRLKYRQYMQ